MIIKCKMCGGDLTIEEGKTVAECEYCGSRQTVPTADNEKKMTLFARANRLRAACEFDKAAGVYEGIVAEFPEEAEAYWGLVLCRYGIEYVDDPRTGRKIPTCHRSSFDSVMEDQDFEQACENADPVARRVYREEAKQIEEIRRGIIEVSGREAPYDIFICYKETDEHGERTIDSVLAQDVYDALTEKGYRVFFARIKLEDKLGQEYEPYIFAALSSAKVMLVFGTDYEYFNAVWVKNEWSRYLKLMAQDKTRHLIPCYKGIDAYDMPKEFAKLQAQDMGKIGAVQDLLRGIGKVLAPEKRPEPQTVVVQQIDSTASNVQSLLGRAFMALEDGQFDKADEFCEQVLNLDFQNARAYLGKLMAERKVRHEGDLQKQLKPLDASAHYQKALRFADGALKEKLTGWNAAIIRANEQKRREAEQKRQEKQNAEIEARYQEACRQEFLPLACATFMSIAPYRDSAERAKACADQFNEERRLAALTKVKSDCADMERELRHVRETIAEGDKKAASLTETAAETSRHIAALEQKLSQIRGLFSGSKKQKLQNGINEAKGDLHKTQQQAALLHQEMEEARQREARISDEMASLQNELDALAASDYAKSQRVQLLPADEIARDALKYYYNPKYVQGAGAVAAGKTHTVILKRDGTVVAVGSNNCGECGVSGWRDIVAVSVGSDHTVGLKRDGTVVAVGWNRFKQCDVSGWQDIVAVSAGGHHTVGLKRDGSVVAVGSNAEIIGRDAVQCEVSGWTDIVAVVDGDYHTVGLKRDGSVVAVGYNKMSQCDVSDWTDIVAVAAGYSHTVGLKRDGSVVAVGSNSEGECNVSAWTDIVAIAAGDNHTVGLRRDGMVVAVGDHHVGQCAVSSWSSIAAIAAGYDQTVGFMRDGTIMTTGREINIQRLGCGWTDIGGGLTLE